MKAMKLKKIDLSVVKDFLFQKGERIGLAVCGALALIFLGIGLMKAGGSNVDYAQTLKKNTDQREAGTRVPAAQHPMPNIEVKPVWEDADPDFTQIPWVWVGDGPDTKRQNPLILKIMDDKDHLQMDFVRSGFFCYEPLPGDKVWAIDGAGPMVVQAAPQQGRWQVGNGPRPTKEMKPGRFVVVSAVFPMRAQMEEYAQKLRYANVAELLANPTDLPRALGLNVFRCEKKADNTYTDWVPLYRFDGKDKFEVAKHLEDLYRECYIDEDNPKTLGEQLKSGMITPLPLLANQEYPKLRLKGIKIEEKDGPNALKVPNGTNPPPRRNFGVAMPGQQKNPMNPGKEEPDAKFVKAKISDLPPEFKEKFSGNTEYFDPSGIKTDDKLDPANPQLNRPKVPPPGRRDPRNKSSAPAETTQLYDAVVRFIDSDVEPGKTYMYIFQVRMANPNFENKEVQHQGLAEIKELLSPYTTTPTITIPGEYYYYAMPSELMPNSVIPEGSDRHKTKPNNGVELHTAYGNWTTTVQIHKWVGNFKDFVVTKPVADWAIAERLLTRRGDTIGRPEVMTELPVWNKGKEMFEMQFIPPATNAKKNPRPNAGLPIDYEWGNPPLLLVDFDGGQRWSTKVGAGTVPISWDESATNVLVLTPDGKLVAHNARADFDLANPVSNDTENRESRENRLAAWQKRLRAVRSGK